MCGPTPPDRTEYATGGIITNGPLIGDSREGCELIVASEMERIVRQMREFLDAPG